MNKKFQKNTFIQSVFSIDLFIIIILVEIDKCLHIGTEY